MKATALILLCFLSFLHAYSQQDEREIDSLKQQLNRQIPDTSRISILNSLSELMVDSETEQSIKYAEQELRVSSKINHQKGMAFAYQNLGNGYFNLADYKKSLEYYLNALKIYQALRNKRGILISSGSIGNVLLEMKQPKEALQYFQQSYQIAKELKNKRGMAASLIAIGTVYSDQQEFAKALEYTFESARLFQEMNNIDALGVCYNNIADNYYYLKDYANALKYIKFAIKTAEEADNNYNLSLSLNNAAEYYESMGRTKEAIEYYQRGLQVAKEIQANDRILAAYKGLSKIYKKQGNYKEALEMNEQYVKIDDSIFNIENSQQIAEMQTRYESDKKKKEIELLTKDKKIHQSEIKRQRLISWFVGSGGILVLLLAIIAVRAYIEKRNSNKELDIRNQKLTHAYSIIEEQHKDIKDSINYAKRIQTALLPPLNLNGSPVAEGFVFYKPRDVVSGDFFWMESLKPINGTDEFIVAAVDCTGHGVPGAFMSIVGNNLLQQVVSERKILQPAQILNELNHLLAISLHQSVSQEEVKDGMDMALCKITPTGNNDFKLTFTGANNPCWVITSTESESNEQIRYTPIEESKYFVEIKPDKLPVGKNDKAEATFTEKTVDLKKGDCIYIFTDGYADQFGGPKGKKFKYKSLQQLLISIHQKPMEEQKELLDRSFMEWKGNLEQIDDVCIVGIRC